MALLNTRIGDDLVDQFHGPLQLLFARHFVELHRVLQLWVALQYLLVLVVFIK